MTVPLNGPFHASLDTPLLDFGGEVWDIRAACEATVIFGAPGSGKTSASAKAIRKSFLLSGMGGTFLCAKADEAGNLIKEICACGREADLIVINDTGEWRFNVLDYAARILGGPGFEGNIVEIMRRMDEATKISNPEAKSGGGENKYFDDAAMKWLTNAFPLLLVAEGTIRLSDVNRFISTIPTSPADTQPPADPKKPHPEFLRYTQGYCHQVHERAHNAAHQPNADPNTVRIWREHGSFFTSEVAYLDSRPRSSIASNVTNLIYPFLSGKLAELFATETTVTPDACRHGGFIVVLDLPPVKYGAAGMIAQSLWKYLFGIASQNNATPNGRPVFLYADEVQNFLSATDADLLAMARSSKICTVFITQDYPTYTTKIGEKHADRLLGMFGTRVFHASNSYQTNMAASNLIYKVEKIRVGESINSNIGSGQGADQQGLGGGSSGNISEGRTTGQTSTAYDDYEIPPDYFATKLRTGTQRNGYKVDGIVIRTGRNWKRTGRHWVQAEFDQRA